MPPPNYLDLDLRIERAGDKYRAQVSNNPVGQAPSEFALQVGSAEFNAMLNALANPQRAGAKFIKRIGKQLFEFVFDGDARAILKQSQNDAEQQGLGLRIRLDIDASELAGLPWEFLYDEALNRFYGLSTFTPIVRFIPLPERIRALGVKPPLRILTVIASPSDYEALDTAREWNNLQTALAPLQARGLIVLEELQEPSLAGLQRALQTAQEWHIFHFVGHGEFDEQAQDGTLVFQQPDTRGHRVTAEQLGRVLHDHRSLRLVVLNACEGAQTSRVNPFAGVAPSLIQQGIPAVIAMQAKITDESAITFSNQFYSALASSFPVDAAVGEARKTIATQGNEWEWGIPVLYLRAPDGKIFNVAASRVAQPAAPEIVVPLPTNVTTKPARIFISYKHDADPDQSLAVALAEFFTRQGHSVFIDRTLRTGVAWLDEIDRQLKQSDFLIVLLSKKSADSEMVKAEVARAYEYRKQQNKPQTLPVRIAYLDLLPYALSAFLDPLQYITWRDAGDTERVCMELHRVLNGELPNPIPAQAVSPSQNKIVSEDGRIVTDEKTLMAPLPEFDPRFLQELDAPGGAVKLRDKFYIERDEDAFLKREIVKTGTTTTIRASRQTGKSSLLVRGIQHAKEKGAQVVHMDLQTVNSEQFASLDVWARYLSDVILRRLKLDSTQLDKLWQGNLGPLDKLSYLMEDYVLPARENSIILALDEADRLLDTKFYQDFFGMVRAWHNNRAIEDLWNRLNIVMVISTEPYLLIPDVTQSPFNVGLKLYLEDFDAKQVQALNERHGSPIQAHEFSAFMDLLDGHPYLTRKALYTLVTEEMKWSELAQVAASDQGPFSDHLRRQQWLLRDAPELRAALKLVIEKNQSTDDMAYFRLLRAGLVKGSGNACSLRCALYREYFAKKL